MQLFEIIFCTLIVLLLFNRNTVRPIHPLLRPSYILFLALAVLSLGIVLEGFRWQMIPAYTAFAVLAVASFRRSNTRILWRVFGTVIVGIILSLSILLTLGMPVISLPEPSGQYAVGTFGYSLTDQSRLEWYEPTRKRELYVQVWYPADTDNTQDYPVRTLWQELYTGDFDAISFFSNYLKNIETHSHVEAPIARGEKFPVLLYNPGLAGTTDINNLLMEHLASHGYVIFSIAHPYQMAKVHLAESGTIPIIFQDSTERESQIMRFRDEEIGVNGVGSGIDPLFNTDEEMPRAMTFEQVVDSFVVAPDEEARRAIAARVLSQGEVRLFGESLSEELLYRRAMTRWFNNIAIQTWVEDTQFVADNIGNIDTTVEGFTEILDTTGFGILGYSYGGAASGEFCKVDIRCIAGSNLDGTQHGFNWDSPVLAPFFLLNSTTGTGLNDFAYIPPINDFLDYTIANTSHQDFSDNAIIFPILQTFGVRGELEGLRTIEIINALQLRFFDFYLKGKPMPSDLGMEFPEVSIREH